SREGGEHPRRAVGWRTHIRLWNCYCDCDWRHDGSNPLCRASDQISPSCSIRDRCRTKDLTRAGVERALATLRQAASRARALVYTVRATTTRPWNEQPNTT